MLTFMRLVGPAILLLFLFSGCGIEEAEVLAPELTQSYTVNLSIYPPNSLRTTDTWSYWTTPVQLQFETTFEGAVADHGSDHKPGAISEEDEVILAEFNVAGMTVEVIAGHAEDFWSFHHGGDMEEHHAEAGEQHIEVHVVDDATGHHAHGGSNIPNCEVTLLAESVSDTFEISLRAVQAGHGFRYEANAPLPYGTYNFTVQIEPPTFDRSVNKKNYWTGDIEEVMAGFVFDSVFASGTVGSALSVGAAGDSMKITLRAGPVKSYGAVSLGEVPVTGDETVNFSVRLEDPTTEGHGEPLFNSGVIISMMNNETGEQTSQILGPMFMDHGFHYGANMMIPAGNGHPH